MNTHDDLAFLHLACCASLSLLYNRAPFIRPDFTTIDETVSMH